MKIQRSVFARSSLKGLSEDQKYWAVSALLIENDIASLMSAALLSVRQESGQVLRDARNSQYLFFLQLLAGKLYEAWEWTQKGPLSTPAFAQTYARLPVEARSALDELKRYFGQGDNRIRAMRNKLASHYDRDVLMSSLSALPENEEIELWHTGAFGSTRTNVGYLFTVPAMDHDFASTDGRKGCEVFLADIGTVTVYFAQFFEGMLTTFLRCTTMTYRETIGIADPAAADLHPFPNRPWAKP